MVETTNNVIVILLDQNQPFVMNTLDNVNVRRTLLDVDVTDVLQHFTALDKMVVHVRFISRALVSTGL